MSQEEHWKKAYRELEEKHRAALALEPEQVKSLTAKLTALEKDYRNTWHRFEKYRHLVNDIQEGLSAIEADPNNTLSEFTQKTLEKLKTKFSLVQQ